MHRLSVVMYHYVRELKDSRYPSIKGLELSLFREQIKYIQKHYQVVSMNDVISCARGERSLPAKAALLTFDDGYAEHFNRVFPILDQAGLPGAFYPPARAVLENDVLDVNKIHFILASAPDKALLVREVFALLERFRDEYRLISGEEYFVELAIEDRFDPREVIFVKRLLQVALPERLRNVMSQILFERFVGKDVKSFSKELYVSLDQLRVMARNGMHIGSHGYDHYWLNSLSKDKQAEEIKRSLAFLESVGVDLSRWTMCYPYGAYNADTLALLEEFHCQAALTTVTDVADVSTETRFRLPRLDTNDLPKDASVQPNEWLGRG